MYPLFLNYLQIRFSWIVHINASVLHYKLCNDYRVKGKLRRYGRKGLGRRQKENYPGKVLKRNMTIPTKL